MTVNPVLHWSVCYKIYTRLSGRWINFCFMYLSNSNRCMYSSHVVQFYLHQIHSYHLILIRTRTDTNTVSKNELIMMSIPISSIYYKILIFISIQFMCVLKCNKCQGKVEEHCLYLTVESCWGILILQLMRKSGDVMDNIWVNFWWAGIIFSFNFKNCKRLWKW